MSKCYINPPIIEAICEFRFSKNTVWDSIIPGVFYEEIKDNFPKRKQKIFQEFKLNQKENGEVEHGVIAHQLIQFLNQDGTKLLQLGDRMLTINILSPYSSWDEFFSIIKETYAKLYNQLETIDNNDEPISIDRIGLRYINQIVIPNSDEVISTDKYFNICPNIPEDFKRSDLNRFMFEYEMEYSENGICRIHFQNAQHTSTDFRFNLDLDYRTKNRLESNCDIIFDWIEKSHKDIETIFESSITEYTREIFGEQS